MIIPTTERRWQEKVTHKHLCILHRSEHLNYIGEVDPIGPVIISLESPVPNHRTKVIVRTKYVGRSMSLIISGS